MAIETMQWTSPRIRRDQWGSGPWDGEPDKKQWQDPVTGLACLAVRAHHGAWCGYVGMPANHPLHGSNYSDVEPQPDCHGGLTFADKCQPHPAGDEFGGICHVADEEVWWLGFDCAHGGDYCPLHGTFARDSYRTLAYVEAECAKLALQLAEPK